MLIEKDRDMYCQIKLWSGEEEIATARIHNEIDNGDWVDIEIPKGREIIGFYGNNKERMGLRSIGLNLWTPNPKALD